MFTIYKKLIYMICFVCPAYSVKPAKVSFSSISEKNAKPFVQGEGAFWALREYDAFIRSGKELKNAFRNLIQYIKENNICIPESSNLGLSSKKNGESYRFKMSFSMDDVADLQYLFNKSMNKVTAHSNLASMSKRLAKFHDETNHILSGIKLLSKEYSGEAVSENDTSVEQDSSAQLSYIRQTNDVLEVTTSLPSNISLEVRLVGGKARDLTPHLDDNTVCVFSIDAQGVYESLPFTRNTRKKRYLKDGESYLWFGTKHGIFPQAVYSELSAFGVEQAAISPLAHGVERRDYGRPEEMPVSLLLIVKSSRNNKGYIAFPKTVENFQAFLTPKSDTLKKKQEVNV